MILNYPIVLEMHLKMFQIPDNHENTLEADIFYKNQDDEITYDNDHLELVRYGYRCDKDLHPFQLIYAGSG